MRLVVDWPYVGTATWFAGDSGDRIFRAAWLCRPDHYLSKQVVAEEWGVCSWTIAYSPARS